jgi:hypothetical protein
VVYRIEQIHPGAEKQDRYGNSYRENTVRLVIEEVLKGKLRQPVGQPFDHRVQSYRGGRDYVGMWSFPWMAPGARQLVFCQGDVDDATALLTDEHCAPPQDPTPVALADIREALRLEKAKATPAAVLKQAKAQAAKRGSHFASYVWARVEPDVVKSPSTFSTLIAIIEDPRTTRDGRWTYLYNLRQKVFLPLPQPQRDLQMRLTKTLFRLLSMPEGKTRHDNLVTVDLPNAVFLEAFQLETATPRYRADEVFHGDRAARLKAVEALQGMAETPQRRRLLEWLRNVAP